MALGPYVSSFRYQDFVQAPCPYNAGGLLGHIELASSGQSTGEVIVLANESVYFAIDKDVGLHDTTLLKRALDSLPGITSIDINKQSSSIAVDYDTTSVTQAEIRKKIEILGYPIQPAR